MGQKMPEINMALRLTHFRRLFFLLICVASLHACRGGGGLDQSPGGIGAPDQSPGGIWFGDDSGGERILAIVTETGRFHFLKTGIFTGSGVVNVSNVNQVSAGFQLVPPLGVTFADGSTFSNCSLDATLNERSTLDGTLDCTTSMGNQSSVTFFLNDIGQYDLGSDLAIMAGTWTDADNPGIDSISIDAAGVILGQDASGSNCFYNGQVSIIDTKFNAYGFEWTYSNCADQSAVLNGVMFSGIGAMDFSTNPIHFYFGATGIVQGNPVSLLIAYGKM